MSFPSHPRGWFSIFLYRYLIYTGFQHLKPVGINVSASAAHNGSLGVTSSIIFRTQKSRGAWYRFGDISATRLSR